MRFRASRWRFIITRCAAKRKKRTNFINGFCRCCGWTRFRKFVQLIKLVQQEVGMGHERVRAPRCVMAGAERKVALETLKAALAKRPKV